MPKWRSVRVRQELWEAVKRSQNQSFSQFVSEAVQMRLGELEQNQETLRKSVFELSETTSRQNEEAARLKSNIAESTKKLKDIKGE